MFLDVLEKLLTTELLDCTSGSIWWVKGISLGCGQQYFTSVIGGSCFALEQAEAPLEHLLDGGRISRKRETAILRPAAIDNKTRKDHKSSRAF